MKNELLKKIEKVTEILFVVFLIIQPLLDNHYLFDKSLISIMGVTVPTFIRISFIVILLGLYSYIWIKKDKDFLILHKKTFIRIILAYLLYFIVHHIVANGYVSSFANLYSYSFFSDIKYFIKTLIPLILTLLFIRFDIRKYLKLIIISWVILISGSIVLTNIMNISLGSYTNEVIKGSIFTWNKGIYEEWSFLQVASKGFFRYANEVSAIMAVMVPLMTYYALKEKKITDLFLLFLLEIAMLMVGTKVALYSFILMFIATTVIFYIYDILNSDIKIGFYQLILIFSVVGSFILIYPYTPSVHRSASTDQTIENAENQEVENQIQQTLEIEEEIVVNQEFTNPNKIEIDSSNDPNTPTVNVLVPNINETEPLQNEKEDNDGNSLFLERIKNPIVSIEASDMPLDQMYDYIEEVFPNKQMNKRFILDVYKYNIDPQFWYEILQLEPSKTMDNRFMERAILQRVKSVNNNKIESLTGMGYSRMHNLYPLEQDFVAHYYTIGLVGILLFLGQYFIVFILGIALLIRGRIFKIKGVHATLYLSLIFIVIISISSGNVIDSLFTPVLLSALVAVLINNYFDKNLID